MESIQISFTTGSWLILSYSESLTTSPTFSSSLPQLLPIPAVLQECLLAKAKMEQGLGLFSEVGVEIDVTDDPNDVSNEALDITMRVKEPRRFTGGVHTLVGNNDGSLMISFKVRNEEKVGFMSTSIRVGFSCR